MTSRKTQKPNGPGKPTNQRAAQKALIRKRGKGYMAELATKGGDATRKKYGVDFYREISKLGVERRRRIREAGLAALEAAEK